MFRRAVDDRRGSCKTHAKSSKLFTPFSHACADGGDEWDVGDPIEQQPLFSVYVNSLAYKGSEEPSMFANRVIEEPVNTRWGYAQFSLVGATLKMIQAALKDPRNR